MIPVTLPKLSISMEEGKVLSWLVSDGAEVTAGQPVVEIETDKATMEVEAPADGVLRIVAGEGTVAAVESTIAEILEPQAEAAPTPPPTEEPAIAAPAPLAGSTGAPPSTARRDGKEAVAAPRERKQVASPAARRLAEQHGIDLAAVEGSGPGGRIVAADVERAAASRRIEPAKELPGTGREAPARAREPAATPVAGLRGAVLANITASWREIPHIHIGGELAAEGLVEARRAAAGRAGQKLTVTDFLILAVARALTDVPELNATLKGDGAERSQRVNLGLAIATGDGLVAPVVRDAADLGLGAIGRERARLVKAARAGALDRRDLGGATCTLSNLGGYPVDFFVPVISGPQIALVATGRLAERPVAIDGMLAVRPRLWVNVAIDHRGADGEAGGRFLAALERRIAELPASV